MKTNSRSKSKKRHSNSQKKIKTEEDFFNNIMQINIDKPGSAYNYYIKEQMTKNKITKVAEASKLFAPKWNNMNDKDKDKYEKIVEEEKIRYDENMKLVKKYLIDPDKLKEQVSPYMAFKRAYVDNAINQQNREPSEAREEAKEEWEKLTKDERKEWEDTFDKNKDLLEELKKFKPGLINAYSMFVRDKVANSKMNFTEASEAWKKASSTQKEKYERYAADENKERKKKISLWEVMSGIKPKRPVGALTHFIKDLSKKRKLDGVKNIFSHAAAKYKELSDSEREQFEKIQKQEQLEYTIKMAEYKRFLSNRFGRAPSALNLYVQDHSSEIDTNDLKQGDFLKLLTEKWKNESDKIKRYYNDKAAEQKEKYDEYKNEQCNLKPPKRPLNAYTIYLQDNYDSYKEKNQKLDSSAIFSLIAEKWGTLKEKEKEPYAKKALLEKERYENEIEEFEKEHGIRGRTKLTQRFHDDRRLLSTKESGYTKYRSQLAYASRSQSKARSKSRSSKSKGKESSSKSNSKTKNSKDKKEKSKSKDGEKKSEKKNGKNSRSRSNSVSSKKSKGGKKK